MQEYVRGQTIHFEVTFTDADGVAFTPSAPTVTIAFRNGASSRGSVTINLEDSGSAWVADWDSRVVHFNQSVHGAGRNPEMIDYTAYSNSPEPKIAIDGQFRLVANHANIAGIP